jgi:beta-galactosidase
LPTSFPIPSYASRAFYDEATLWLARVAKTVSHLVWPNGPIALVQIDNEGALYFRDGPYDQDYHPDAIAHYRRFLRRKLQRVGALRARYRDDSLTFDDIEPPTRFSAEEPDELARHLDWVEFQDTLIELALYRFRGVLARNGLAKTVTFHNLPIADGASPLHQSRIERSVDFVALDYYHHASEETRSEIARRTTALRARSEVRDVPAFAAEMAVGFAPYFPPLTETDNAFSAMAALAYGLTGVNLYMAVGRDRWIGGAIDAHGRSRASAEPWRRLLHAVRKLELWKLSRRVPVRIVKPHCLRHLARATHVFGAVPPSAFALTGHGVEHACLERVAGMSPSPALACERFMRTPC